MITSSADLLYPILSVFCFAEAFVHIRETHHRRDFGLFAKLNALFREQSVRILTKASLAIVTRSPAIDCVIERHSKRVLPTSSHHGHESVFEKCHLLRCWHLLRVCMPTLTPVFVGTSAPGPHLAIDFKCNRMEVAASNLFDFSVLQRSHNILYIWIDP